MRFRLGVYAAFVLSGIAGLIYEVLWARYLGLIVGHSAYAQVIVLSIFLGGMGAGALLAGRYSARLVDPLRWYARVEIVVAVFGLTFDQAFRWVMAAAYEMLLPAAGGGVASFAITWGIAAIAILPQSLLLGTTFPLITAGLLRRDAARPGRSLALLYFTNSIGAAGGVLLGGFVFVPWIGLPGALLAAAGLNLAAGGAAYLLAAVRPPARDLVETLPRVREPTTRAAVGPLLLWVAFGTAVASFFYEVAWIRMLALLLGSATHAFELMLSAFILGLALGAFWVRTRADRWDAVQALGWIQCAMGVAALAALPVYVAAFDWVSVLMQTFTRSDTGYAAFSLSRYAISLAIMLPATFCAGTTLPLITRALLERGAGERAIGRVYGVNTLGSIAGVVVAALVLLPLIGLKHTLVVGAAVDLGLGVLVLRTAHEWRFRRAVPGVLAAAAGLVFVALVSPNFDRQLLTSGVYRDGVLPPRGAAETLYYRDGRTATVTAFRRADLGVTIISTNGKPDASMPDAWRAPCTPATPRAPLDGDMATQTLAPLIAAAHAPAAVRAAVVGLGSGLSSQVLLGRPTVAKLTTIEIEPAMAEGARAFLPANRRVYDDPRSDLVFEDARAYFAATDEQFDLIFSEPSNPWVSGVASLFTTEFYRRVAGSLGETGIFGQWLHLYELSDELVLSVLAAIHATFPSYAVYQAWEADLVIVASPAPVLPAAAWTAVVTAAGVAEDFCRVPRFSAPMLDVTRLLTRAELAPLLDRWGSANSDFYPTLDLGAERQRYLRRSARGFVGLTAARFDVPAVLRQAPRPRATDTLAPVSRIPRMQAQAIAASLRVGAGGSAVLGGNARGRARHAYRRWTESLRAQTGPADWVTWLEEFAAVERLVHGASQGVADEAFYAAASRFAAQWQAPPPVHDVLALRQAAARWDFPAARVRSAALLAGVLGNTGLMAAEEFLDIGVTAHLMTGDPQGAGALLQQVAPRTGRAADDVRLLLLAAHVLQARERAGGATR